MSISKTAAFNQAMSEIARSSNDNSKFMTIRLLDNKKDEWIVTGRMGRRASLKFQRRFVENRMLELLKAS